MPGQTLTVQFREKGAVDLPWLGGDQPRWRSSREHRTTSIDWPSNRRGGVVEEGRRRRKDRIVTFRREIRAAERGVEEKRRERKKKRW